MHLDFLPPLGLYHSSVHGILPARILECITISFSRGSSQARSPVCPQTDSLPCEPSGKLEKNTTILHWPGIEPRSPPWEARILPLNHQCHSRGDVCNDCLLGVLFSSFSTAGHSCPLFPGWSRFSFSALRGTSCPLPAEGCFGRQSGVLWLRLSAGTACCSCSLAQPCPTL